MSNEGTDKQTLKGEQTDGHTERLSDRWTIMDGQMEGQTNRLKRVNRQMETRKD